jgi:type 1 glutamine amidotransferase
MTERIDAYLVAGGRYHDIDYARIEILKLLAEHAHVRTRVGADFRDVEGIQSSRFLITYTCDLRPSPAEQEALHDFVASGGRWLALHGTNSVLDFTKGGVEAPRVIDRLAFTLGTQFIAHPPIQLYKVETSMPDHPLVEGIGSFETDDELYLCEYHERERLIPLLETSYSGSADGFAVSDWPNNESHLVMYLRPLGDGAVLYNTLGHCRGHYDMQPVMDYYPQIERCSWELPQFYELLRRGIRWCLGEIDGGTESRQAKGSKN